MCARSVQLVRGQRQVTRLVGARAAPTVWLLGGYPSTPPAVGPVSRLRPPPSQTNCPALPLPAMPWDGGWARV
eukprot:6185518-Pleurochrysis_carterae.AAC.2